MFVPPFPSEGNINWEVFSQPSPATGAGRAWYKPAGCSWFYAFMAGGGGGGAGGASGAVDTPRGGGGGGAGGQQVIVLAPAIFIPPVLFARIGAGGIGGAAGATGTSGGASWLVTKTALNDGNARPFGQAVGGNGGSPGTSSAGGAGGGGSGSASNNGYLTPYVFFSSVGGGAGGAGGAHTGSNGGDSFPSTSCQGGTGGGGVTSISPQRGGNINGEPNLAIPGLLIQAGSSSTSPDGGHGPRPRLDPGFMRQISSTNIFLAGAGGVGLNTAQGGNGGNGSWACGGGGGGAGTTGGRGGDGGDGFIIIGTW